MKIQKENTEISKSEVFAVRNLKKGEASHSEQRLALQVILHKVCKTDINPYAGDVNETHIAIGRADVGRQIRMMINADIDKMFPEDKG